MKSFFFLMIVFPTVVNANDYKLLTIDEITQITPEMIQFLEENIPQDASHNEKLVQLVKLIFNKDFLNLSYDNNRTKTAKDTFETRSGNCLSFTNMFVVMARHLGLNARFQEVHNLPTWDRNGRVVVLNRHINVLVHVREREITVDFNPYEEHRQIRTQVVNDNRAYAQFFNNFGAEAFANDQNEVAKRNFHRSIEIDPEMSFSRTNLGVVFSSEGSYKLAEATYLKALKLSRNDYTALNNLAALYVKTGNRERAEFYTKKANHFRRKNPYYHYKQGMSAMQSKQFEQAVVHFKRAIRRKQEEHQFYFAMAKAYAYMGKKDKVQSNLEKAQNYAPEVFDQQRYSQKLNMLAVR